jgi:hypothetical protein
MKCFVAIFQYILFFCVKTSVQAQNLDGSLVEVSPGAHVILLLDKPEFYSNSRIEWELFSENKDLRCILSVRSYYDEQLVRQLRYVQYFITQTAYSDSTGKYNTKWSATWRADLDHANKALPALGLDCFLSSTSSSFFTSEDVELLSGGQIAFSDRVTSKDVFTPLSKMMPSYPRTVMVHTPLAFSMQSLSSNSATVSTLFAVEGQLFSSLDSRQREGGYCSLSYHWSILGKDAEITIFPGLGLDQNWISQHCHQRLKGAPSYGFSIGSTMSQGLSITCDHPKHFESFSEIQSHLRGIIEFR